LKTHCGVGGLSQQPLMAKEFLAARTEFSNFEKLHSQAYNDQVSLYAFDLLELNGGD
jgi:hypothetical protein